MPPLQSFNLTIERSKECVEICFNYADCDEFPDDWRDVGEHMGKCAEQVFESLSDLIKRFYKRKGEIEIRTDPDECVVRFERLRVARIDVAFLRPWLKRRFEEKLNTAGLHAIVGKYSVRWVFPPRQLSLWNNGSGIRKRKRHVKVEWTSPLSGNSGSSPGKLPYVARLLQAVARSGECEVTYIKNERPTNGLPSMLHRWEVCCLHPQQS